MNAILIKIFATALALSQVTTQPDAIKTQLDPARDRLMMCGGPSVLADLKAILIARGFEEGSLASPGDFVLEKAFVET